ncbi:MAG: hypothetical protein IJX67_10375 [Oscillospiraceae bacterium]|nr:hypothetical protein [Oscillospiraceae bacterium]
MKNYISINNQKVELTDEQVEKIKTALDLPSKRLSDIAIGDVCRIGTHEFIVLEQSGDTTAVIRKELLKDNVRFGDNNNFNGSNVDKICKDFANELASVVGDDNLVLHTVDLTSDDGLKDYGKVMRQVSLLTANLYRRYVEVLDKHKPDEYWWLATPFSTKVHDNDVWVKCVSPSGYFDNYYYYVNVSLGVRPFCILKSHIFVS